MIWHNPQPEPATWLKPWNKGSRWANAKPERWWKFASPRARSRQHQRAYNAEHNAAQAFAWMLDKHNWRRHPRPFAKTASGRKRRQERLFHQQHQQEHQL